MYAHSGSAPGHMMLLPHIHIPQAPLPLCSHPYSDPTRLVLRGERQVPGQVASASEECSSLQGGKLQLIKERDPVTTININQPINHKWIVTLIRQTTLIWHDTYHIICDTVHKLLGKSQFTNHCGTAFQLLASSIGSSRSLILVGCKPCRTNFSDRSNALIVASHA